MLSFGFFVNGRAGPDFDGDRKTFSGSMRQTSSNWIATELKLKIDVVLAGKKESFEALQPVWIEPNSDAFVSFELSQIPDETWKELEECLKNNEFSSCLTWGITEQYGVEIK